MRKFHNKTEDLCTPVARAIQREQELQSINNEHLANVAKVTVRTVLRIKAGGQTTVRTLESVLDALGLELTAQPIGADFREQMKNV